MNKKQKDSFIVDLTRLNTLKAPERKKLMRLARGLWHKRVLEERNRSIFGTEQVSGFPQPQKELFEIISRIITAKGKVWDFDCNSLSSIERLQYCFSDIAITLERESEKVSDSEVLHCAHVRVRESGELAFSAKLFYKNADKDPKKQLFGKVFVCSSEGHWETTLRAEWNRYWKGELSDRKMFEKMPLVAYINMRARAKAPV